MSAASGTLLLAVPVAFAAGAVSFASPCVLPLVPGYLSYVAGLSGAEVAATTARAAATGHPASAATGAAAAPSAPGPAAPTRLRRLRSRTVAGALLFVLGFTVVFTSYGAVFGTLGQSLVSHQRGLETALGALTIVLGLAFAGVFVRLPLANREFRLHRLPAAGVAGAPLLGALFGLGWTPCIGPTLATVLGLAASDSTATASRGALLTAVYCLGLGLPFVLAAAALRASVGFFAALRRHTRLITVAGGVLLVAVGVAEVTGTWSALLVHLRSTTTGFTVTL